MSDVNTVVGLVLLTVGALYCFAGWPLYKLMVAISGFVVGGGIGLLIGNYLVSQSSTYSADPTMIAMIALVTGIVGALLAVALINVVAFFFGFAYFAAGTGLVLALQDAEQSTIVGLAIVMGIVGGILAVVLLRLIVTLSTAFSGAFLMTLGASGFGLIPDNDSALLVILVLAVLGIVVQYGVWKPQQPSQVPAGPSPPPSTSPSVPLTGATSPVVPDTDAGTSSPVPAAMPTMGAPPSSAVAESSAQRFCSQCGAQVTIESSRFCGKCGARLS